MNSASVARLLLLAAIQIARDQEWNMALVLGVSVGVMALGAALLTTAINTARRVRLEEEVV